jgi:putative transposase
MERLFQSLFLLLATAAGNTLAKQVQFLKVENEILRSKLPRRIRVTPRERSRLLRFGQALGTVIRELITIVSPRTFARWNREARAGATPIEPVRTGRPRTADDLRDLILKIARDTGWGYTRILGELKKLGVSGVSRSTVVNILKENGVETGPQRGAGCWADFVKRHAATLWACDFLSTRIWTIKGRVEIFVLFFLHVGSRRVHLAGMTANPDHQWVGAQANAVAARLATQDHKPTFLLRDLDSKYSPEFDTAFEDLGMEVLKLGPRKPNLNAYAERWVLSIRSECLDHFLIFGEAHLRYILQQYLAHYNDGERPHQGIGNRPLGEAQPRATSLPFVPSTVVCDQRLGGVLKHFRRAA